MRHDYRFVSHWSMPASRAAVWAALEASLAPGILSWWPAVRVLRAPPRLHPGAEVTLEVRSAFGYRLRVELTLTEVTPPDRLAAVSAGDLAGHGSLDVGDAAGGARLTWTWDVATERRWMRWTGPALRPVFTLAHRLVMRRGERGFRALVI